MNQVTCYHKNPKKHVDSEKYLRSGFKIICVSVGDCPKNNFQCYAKIKLATMVMDMHVCMCLVLKHF